MLAVGLLAAGIPCAAAPPSGAPAPAMETGAWVLRNGHWFDGDTFVDGDHYVVDGRFVDAPPPAPYRTLDLQQHYVVPPYGEAHNHNLDNLNDAPGQIRHYLHDGVFYVEIPLDVAEQVEPLRPLINRPDSVDVIYAHAGLTGTDGHPAKVYDFVAERPGSPYPGGYLGHAYLFVDSADDLARVWPTLLATRPDFIKIFLLYTDSFRKRRNDRAFRGLKGLDPALVPLVVERAHAVGLRVAAHVETTADFRAAVQGGVDQVAHLPGYSFGVFNVERYALTPEDATLAAARGVTVVTTTSIARNDPGNRLAVIEDNQITNLRLLRRAGVHLAIGSDDYRETSANEAANLARLGAFDARTLLNLWTRDTAQAIFPDRKVGRLAPGYEASFLALAGNPLEDFSRTAQIRVRFKQGYLISE